MKNPCLSPGQDRENDWRHDLVPGLRKPVMLCIDATVDAGEFWLLGNWPGVTLLPAVNSQSRSRLYWPLRAADTPSRIEKRWCRRGARYEPQ